MGIIGTVTNISLIDMLSGSAAVNETAGGTAGMFFEAGDGLASAGYIGILAKQCITDANLQCRIFLCDHLVFEE